jgi:microcystin-dependent protein
MGQGPGLNPYVLGQSGGGEQISLTVANLPPHTHAVAVDNGAPNSPTRTPATNTYLATTPRNEAPVYSSGSPTVALGAGTVGNIGSALPVSIVQPSLCVTFIVALAGIFPSRN